MKKIYFLFLFVTAFIVFGISENSKAQVSCAGTIQANTLPTYGSFITVGNGTPGCVKICLTNNTLAATMCSGNTEQIIIRNTAGTIVAQWTSGTANGTCFTLATNDGYARLSKIICSGGDATLTWTTVNCATGVDQCTPPPAHCSNGVMDVDETGVDCGGSCTPCVTCTTNDLCTGAIALTSGVTTTACNNGASNGPLITGGNAAACDMSTNPTVWFSFTTGAADVAATIQISNTCFTQPHFTIFSACNTYLPSSCTQGSSLVGYNPLNPNTTYYIPVTDQGGLECDFDITVTTFPDNSACATSTSLVANTAPPYLPGTTVQFTFSVLEWTKVTCNWLQGIVPSWGSCWDDASMATVQMPTNGSGQGTWGWYNDGVITYNDNAGGYSAGDPVGAGWFYHNTSAGPAGPDPNSTWGDHGAPGGGGWMTCDISPAPWSVVFSLTVATPVLPEECTNGEDCGVSVKTFADGEIGGYTNLACVTDLPTNFAAEVICPAPLPIELMSFSANQANEGVVLNWATASEINNDYFIIERSVDGKKFEPIIRLKGAGNSHEFIKYETVDKTPIKGLNYYQLRQVDYDGSFAYSDIIGVHFSNRSDMVQIIPNPARENTQINFTALASEKITLELFDGTGRLVTSQNHVVTKGANNINLNLSEYPKGIYFLSLTNGYDIIRKKFLIE